MQEPDSRKVIVGEDDGVVIFQSLWGFVLIPSPVGGSMYHPYTSIGGPLIWQFGLFGRWLGNSCFRPRSLATNIPSQVPSLDEILNCIIQLDALFSVVAVVPVESTVFIPVPYGRGGLHGTGPLEIVFLLYLHEDLLSREVEGGVGVESSSQCSGLGRASPAVCISAAVVIGSLGALPPVILLL